MTRIQAVELLKAAPSDERYTIEVNDAFDGTGTAKAILKWFSIGKLRAVWDSDLVLLRKEEQAQEKEVIAPRHPTFEEAVEMNTRFDLGDEHQAETPLTEKQKEYWLNAYHEGYEQAKSEFSHIVNP